eukprot:TRINITY_DN1078_c0_g1_i1.p1 TRINITY_DN1078_c0_g1~~TRINITY_DN1078_c0_g1_i1.p1  ORF type:complete len:428 (+),score=94.02 TRINITY_DN1078_c0_g1_i1:64-1347(+)
MNSRHLSLSSNVPSTVLLFTISHKPGSLHSVLESLKEEEINMKKIESRPGRSSNSYDFFLEVELDSTSPKLSPLIKKIEQHASNLKVVGGVQIPNFPRRPRDLDAIADKTLQYGEALDADHPGFTDEVYRKRREEITNIAKTYRYGHPIPRVEYTDVEKGTWRTVYLRLKELYQTTACSQFNYIFPLLEQNCGYSPDNIPQLEDVSAFLHDCTGFSLRPVTGLLSSRDFLNGLAFRIFHSTQYIRHHTVPEYTPEPDICHELLGHVPLFADPDFAQFSQEIGLASLGASDDDIKRLATLYWFTVEFGVCLQEGQIKAYGAGILSSVGELENVKSGKPEMRPLNILEAANTEYPITKYQPFYWMAYSFQDATAKLREFVASHMSRGFQVIYNPYTQSVEVLESREQLCQFAKAVSAQVNTLAEALAHL